MLRVRYEREEEEDEEKERKRKRTAEAKKEEEERRRCDLASSLLLLPRLPRQVRKMMHASLSLTAAALPKGSPCAASNASPLAPVERTRLANLQGKRASSKAPRARRTMAKTARRGGGSNVLRRLSRKRSLASALSLIPFILAGPPSKDLKSSLLTCSLAMISTRSFCQTPTHLGWGVLMGERSRER